MRIIHEEVEVRQHSRSPRWRWLAPVAIVVVVGWGVAAWLGDRGGKDRREPPPEPAQAVAVSPNQAVFMVWTEYERWRTASECAGEAGVRESEAFKSTARYVSMAADALGVTPLAPDPGSVKPVDLSTIYVPIDPACLPQAELVDISDAEAVLNAVGDASKDRTFLETIATLVWEDENPGEYSAMRLEAAADPGWPPFEDRAEAAALLAVLVADVEGESTWRAVGTITADSILIAYGQDYAGSVLVIQVAQPTGVVKGDSGFGWPWLLACGAYEVTVDTGLHRTPVDAEEVRESLVALCAGTT